MNRSRISRGKRTPFTKGNANNVDDEFVEMRDVNDNHKKIKIGRQTTVCVRASNTGNTATEMLWITQTLVFARHLVVGTGALKTLSNNI
jgi:hypothetical protein